MNIKLHFFLVALVFAMQSGCSIRLTSPPSLGSKRTIGTGNNPCADGEPAGECYCTILVRDAETARKRGLGWGVASLVAGTVLSVYGAAAGDQPEKQWWVQKRSGLVAGTAGGALVGAGGLMINLGKRRAETETTAFKIGTSQSTDNEKLQGCAAAYSRDTAELAATLSEQARDLQKKVQDYAQALSTSTEEMTKSKDPNIYDLGIELQHKFSDELETDLKLK